MRARNRLAVPLALAVGAIVVAAGLGFLNLIPPAPALKSSVPPTVFDFRIINTSGDLGPTFVNGAPQAFGFNGTSVLVTGVVGDPGPNTEPLALLGTLGGTPGNPIPENLSREVAGLFHAGDTLGIAWNGTSWLLTGEAAWGSLATGAAATLQDGRWTNLTPILEPYFSGQNGGIWFDAWNGTAWLLGGASDSGASLVSVQGSTIRDLTPEISHNAPGKWIQFLAWNGSAWLVGGQGVFGVLVGDQYTDLFPRSAFTQGGMFAADWNGTEWLVGGGPAGVVEILRGLMLTPGPPLAASFSWWVSSIVWDGRGWYIGGEGGSSTLAYAAALEYLDASTGVLVDLSPLLPGAFDDGQIEFGASAPFYAGGSILMVGQGGLHYPKGSGGPSHGAAATVSRE